LALATAGGGGRWWELTAADGDSSWGWWLHGKEKCVLDFWVKEK